MFIREKVPKELIVFYHYIEDVINRPHLLELEIFTQSYQDFRLYLNNTRKDWFPRSRIKTGKDEYYAEQLFTGEIHCKDIKHSIKIHLIAIILSADRYYSKISQHLKNQDFTTHVYNELLLFNELVRETIQFLNWNQYHIKGYPAGYHMDKRMVLHSAEIFSASKMLLRNKIIEKNMGDFVVRPTSVFLLRQSIELRLKNAFGIYKLTDMNGKSIKFPTSRILFQLIKDDPNSIIFPIKISLVEKIYKWSNYYIHLGTIPNIWEIEWAHHILEPLFSSGSYKNIKSIFGSIKIKRNYYDQIDLKIKKLVGNTEIKIERCPSPESLLID